MSKKGEIVEAAKQAIDELIITNAEDDISADKMKNAASAKRLAFEDAMYMLNKIEEEENKAAEGPIVEVTLGKSGFAEGRARHGK